MSAAFPPAHELDALATRSYLLNVADAINNVLAPQLTAGTKSRADECVVILLRVAQQLADATRIEPSATGTAAADIAKVLAREGAALDNAETALEQINEKLHDAQQSSSRTFDRDRFERYLQQHERGGGALRVTEAKVLAGGRSKQTILISQQGGAQLPNELVVRQDWSSAVTGTSVLSEFKLLRRVWQAGLKVPEPLWLEISSEVIGSPFLLVSRMHGGPQGDIFHPPVSEPLALDLADQLARLHTLPVADFVALDVPVEAYSQAQLRAGLEGFAALQAKLGLPLQTIELALQWLQQQVEHVDGAQALVHNDLGCHNFLIEGEALTAVLDWELAHIGNPAADLGYIRSWVSKMTDWDTFMARYRASGGPTISEATLDFYTIWCGVRLYCLLLQARAGVAMGMVRDTEITYASAHFLPQLVQRISGELRAIIGKS